MQMMLLVLASTTSLDSVPDSYTHPASHAVVLVALQFTLDLIVCMCVAFVKAPVYRPVNCLVSLQQRLRHNCLVSAAEGHEPLASCGVLRCLTRPTVSWSRVILPKGQSGSRVCRYIAGRRSFLINARNTPRDRQKDPPKTASSSCFSLFLVFENTSLKSKAADTVVNAVLF